MFRDYAMACKTGDVRLGKMHVFDLGALAGDRRWIINFPTKGHWRERSRLTDIEAGLEDLVDTVRRLGIRSIAIPPLGCGNGGLNWADVRPHIEAAFVSSPDVNVFLFEPETETSVQLPYQQACKRKGTSVALVHEPKRLHRRASCRAARD